MKKVYYATGYDGRDHEEIIKECNHVKEFLERNNMLLVNNYDREFRENVKLNHKDSEAIIYQNLYFLKRADILIVNLSIHDHKYVGCIGDMIYAKLYNLYVITIAGDNEYDKHFWTFYHSDIMVNTIEEAFEAALSLKLKKKQKMSSSKEADIARWDKIHSTLGGRDSITYDRWLDAFSKVINDCNTPIIDLGCGSGNDSLYLLEKQKDIYACDFSNVAIQKIKENLPEVTPLLFDMTEGFPFKNSFSDIILADLSLHYFSEKMTQKVIKEIKRVLKSGGHFMFRVNSVADVNYGSMQGEKIEENFYKVRGTTKRFFDEESILQFFDGWEVVYLKEDIMPKSNIRTCLNEGSSQKLDKKLWTGVMKKKPYVRKRKEQTI